MVGSGFLDQDIADDIHPVGTKIEKIFEVEGEGRKWYKGIVVSKWNAEEMPLWRIKYEDNDEEDLELAAMEDSANVRILGTQKVAT